MKRSVLYIAAAATSLLSVAASSHPHRAHNGQILANGQNHEPFWPVEGADTSEAVFLIQSCGGDPAVYGLEIAHHGRDQDPGRADGCYTTLGMENPNWPGSGPQYIPVDSSGFQPNN